MSKLTSSDNKSLALFQLHQKTVFRRNTLLKNAPFIASGTAIKIYKCSGEYMYKDPVSVDTGGAERSIEDSAIVSDWRFTSVGCRSIINCNRYFPKGGVCAGLDVGDPSSDRDECFSFTVAKGQTVDACHPMCYYPSNRDDNYIGIYTEYGDGRCIACDPLLLAYYLDPDRRVLHPDKQIKEKDALSVGFRPVGPLSERAYVATIDSKYCDQYGLKYTPEGGRSLDGVKLFHCVIDPEEDSNAFSVSNIVGDVVTRTINMGGVAIKDLIEKTSTRPKTRLDTSLRRPPTQKFLASDELWKANVDATKKPLPFPVSLVALGIVNGTPTEWLMWTDEYSHLDDGRNDEWGGRLVERSRSIPKPLVEFYYPHNRIRRSSNAISTGNAQDMPSNINPNDYIHSIIGFDSNLNPNHYTRINNDLSSNKNNSKYTKISTESSSKSMFRNSEYTKMSTDSTSGKMFRNSEYTKIITDSTSDKMFRNSEYTKIITDSTSDKMFRNSEYTKIITDSTSDKMFRNSEYTKMSTESTSDKMCINSENTKISTESTSKSMFRNKRNVSYSEDGNVDEIQRQLMLRINRSMKDYNDHMNTPRKMSQMLTTTDSVNGLNKILAVMSAEELRVLTKELTTESVKTQGILSTNLKRLMKFVGTGQRVSTKAVGFAMTNSVLRAGLERGLVRHAAKWLKVPLKTVGSAANVLNIVGLIGLASDLFATFVYDPYDRYKRHFSDSALLKLAETELVANQRNIGIRRVNITPHDWMVNTDFLDTSEDAFYDMVLAVMYMTSRRVNSSGGILMWDEYGDCELNTNDDGLVLHDSTPDDVPDINKESSLGSDSRNDNDTRETFALGSGLVKEQRTSNNPRNIRLCTESWNLSVFIIALFILFSAVCLRSHKKDSCVFPVALFSSLVSIAFPLVRM